MNHLNNHKTFGLFLALLLFAVSPSQGQTPKQQWQYTVTPQPEKKGVHVQLRLSGETEKSILFKLPVWTPGYYQLMDFAKNVSNFKATDGNGKMLEWKQNANAWTVDHSSNSGVTLDYDVKTDRNFVGGNFIDQDHMFLSPAGIFLHGSTIKQPVTVTINPYTGWTKLASGMDYLKSDTTTYTAPDFDILYDSPILMGKLETLPGFKIKGIPHNFIGYDMGNFDRIRFMGDLKKIIESGIAVIGDIPYKHYTFLSIGAGGGGIEHLNSTAVTFKGSGLETSRGRLKVYNFLAHEYFHHYNVKRIRPIELGPFDYDKENPTELLWVSEGFSVYYEYLMVHRAGLSTPEELIDHLRDNLMAYENKPGHLYQSVTQSSFQTWTYGPSVKKEDADKTISYYDKGPILGLMLDMKIRQETNNKKSLDDVMRTLYKQYYKKLRRGFTSQEFRTVCEQVAGTDLNEFFSYATTTTAPNYIKYFAYAGLDIDVKSTKFEIKRVLKPTPLQQKIYVSIFGASK
ncbi:M61 family metallopeptidase [Pedobacter duraquae]|uniref:Putative metalloprotease with PDZ domain n=1 Tax=Pedobacter duraquae TaxID=425511 RepID=A0A4R6IRP7_9SPHI|nr:M61 family metallopeptidase [Pedobacter duraquae]TDO24626.1 putative metalloprotease with PDZ domain [Pedobacter duraquae]